jgi:hypothetical protein
VAETTDPSGNPLPPWALGWCYKCSSPQDPGCEGPCCPERLVGYQTLDPFKFANEVERAYRLYQQKLLTAKEFADVTGESLRKRMNYREEAM